MPLEYDELTACLTIPEQMKKFWSSPTNKVLPQKLAREKVSTHDHLHTNAIVSGCATEDGLIPAELHN